MQAELTPSPLRDTTVAVAVPDEKEGDIVVRKEDVRDMTYEDRATALRMALEADPGIPVATLRYLKFQLMILAICLCGGDSGFDGTLLSSINSMVQFQNYFGLEKAVASTSIVFVSSPSFTSTALPGSKTDKSVKGMFNVGAVFAAFPASYLPDRLGR